MTNKQKNRLMVIVIIVGVGVIALMLYTSTGKQSTSPLNVLPQTLPSQSYTPQPPGEVPLGKVWAPEHGHWHDAANPGVNTATATPVQSTAQPAGEAPPGKIWSREHGHWHDALNIPDITIQDNSKTIPRDSQ